MQFKQLGRQVFGAAKCDLQFSGPQRNAGGKISEEKLKAGGRLAFVLPATALTGSRWAPIRELLLNNYDIEWVVVSHDERYRPPQQGLPGRNHVGFSESTRIAETLIVATKKRASGTRSPTHGTTRFVNLRHNPDEPIEAIAIAKAILAMKQAEASTSNEIIVGNVTLAWQHGGVPLPSPIECKSQSSLD